jgi:hypothetical protein
MTEDEALLAVKACLAEVGFPEAPVILHESALFEMNGRLPTILAEYLQPLGGPMPLVYWWMASSLCETPLPCWTCFIGGRSDSMNCLESNCPNPNGDKRPPRELLDAAKLTSDVKVKDGD